MTKTNLRKVILINKNFQIRIVSYFALLASLNIVVFYLAISYFFWSMKEKGMAIGLNTDHIFFTFVNDQQKLMTLIFVLTALVSLTALVLAGFLISHKVAGPLHRLDQQLIMMKEKGKLEKITFRKDDFFREIEESFNSLLEKIYKVL